MRKKRRTINRLSQEQIGWILRRTHRCPRCDTELLYIGLGEARRFEVVVKACPECQKRVGLTMLGNQEVTIFGAR